MTVVDNLCTLRVISGETEEWYDAISTEDIGNSGDTNILNVVVPFLWQLSLPCDGEGILLTLSEEAVWEGSHLMLSTDPATILVLS